ncbi:MAG: HD-GYP domain-containing protein [Candidatus Omnitrophota bacterium]
MKTRTPFILEKFLLADASWQEGFSEISVFLGFPNAWILIFEDEQAILVSLDRKGARAKHRKSDRQRRAIETFLAEYGSRIRQQESRSWDHFLLMALPVKTMGLLFPIIHFGKLKGLFLMEMTEEGIKSRKAIFPIVQHWLHSQTELAYKNFELNNFYETVHPRALALSTMHSVHRVISSSLRLKDLLPRIGRLSAQVLKSKGCSIMLIDPDRKQLVPYFSFGPQSRFVHKHPVPIGRGIEGKMASSGEFFLHKNAIGVPFIEDDVVGVIMLWDRNEAQAYTKVDLEILKTLSEQAVVAIKNAQLFEETERLTMGSIKTINDLLDMNFGGERRHLPIFGEIVMEIANKLGLSLKERMHLERAVFLLDTGTLAVPEKLWRKKGKLTDKEYEMIKSIPERGAYLLRSISSLRPVIPIVLHHHERYDGKGYPEGLSGEKIPIGARIVAVVNSFIAMISQRSYRDRRTVEEAVEEIKQNAGTQFDPEVVRCFVETVAHEAILEKLKKTQERMAFS